MNIFFTADTHLSHENIIKYCNRPFSSVGEMNECILESWNDIVSSNDIVYHLGDVLWKDPTHMIAKIKKLPGKKILIPGNHDTKLEALSEAFEIASPLTETSFTVHGEKRDIVLCHYPMQSWKGSYNGSWHFFGHVHGRIENSFQRLDVGIDSWNFQPIPLELAARSIILPSANHHPLQ